MRLKLPCYSEPSDDFIGGLGENVDLHVLTSRGITLEAAQEALRWACWQRAIEVPVILTSHGLNEFSMDVGFGSIDLSRVRTPSASRTVSSMTAIVRDEKNIEASACALVLAHFLKQHFKDRPGEAPRVPDDQEELPDETETVVLICTRGALGQENTLRALKAAMLLDARCLPVVAEEGFEFPASSFEDDHMGLAERVAGSDVAPEDLLAHVRDIFKIIAARFPAGMASDLVLSTAVGEVARRLRALVGDGVQNKVSKEKSQESGDSSSPKRSTAQQRAELESARAICSEQRRSTRASELRTSRAQRISDTL